MSTLPGKCARCHASTPVLYGFAGVEALTCRGCWYATHDNYPADDGRVIPPDPLKEIPA